MSFFSMSGLRGRYFLTLVMYKKIYNRIQVPFYLFDFKLDECCRNCDRGGAKLLVQFEVYLFLTTLWLGCSPRKLPLCRGTAKVELSGMVHPPGGSMMKPRFTEHQIVTILKQADAGVPVNKKRVRFIFSLWSIEPALRTAWKASGQCYVTEE
jgi:hypothetical protein